MHRIQTNVEKINLDLKNPELAAFAITLWGCCTADLLFESRFSVSVSEWLIQLTESLTINRTAKILKNTAAWFRRYDSSLPWCSCIRTYRSFKRDVGFEKGDELAIKGFIPLIIQFIREPSPLLLEQILTCCEFWTRAPLDQGSLASVAKEEYLAFEMNYPTFEVDHEAIKLRDIIENAMCSWKCDSLGHHSNGATSETTRGAGLIAKERELTVPPSSRAARASYLLGCDLPPMTGKTSHSRWVSVPKTVLTRRSIAAEPTSNQFMQQALLTSLAKHLKEPPFFITMDDQSPNVELAARGSKTREYGTIDLSNASDSVSYELVKFLLKSTPFGRLILYTRTATMKVGDSMINLKKFASMGSAVCFPVECMIFKAIIILAEQNLGLHTYSCVYGDDIVCSDLIFSEVTRLLKHFHFTVNPLKTFPPYHSFKESCGGEFSNGSTLHIFRLSRNFPGYLHHRDVGRRSEHPEKVLGYVSMLNELRRAGLTATRRFALHCLPSSHAIPYGSIGCPGCIETSGPVRNSHLKISNSATMDLQETVYIVSGLKQVEKRPTYDDPLSVQAWLRHASRSHRTGVVWPEDSLQEFLYPYSPTLVFKRSPAWVFETLEGEENERS